MSGRGSQMARGEIDFFRTLSIFAFNGIIGTGLEDLWQGKLLTPPLPNMEYIDIGSAERLLIKSTSPDDTLLGTGTTKVLVDGVDQDFKRVLKQYDTGGTTGILTDELFLGVTVLSAVENAVLGESNKGIITAEGSVSNKIQSIIAIDEGRDQGAHMFVPVDEDAVLTRLHFTGEKNAEYKIVFQVTPFVTTINSTRLTSIPIIFFESSIEINFELPLLLPRASRINVKVLSDTGPSNKVSGSYDLELSKLGVR